jgi:aspartyl-tRNA synthetase
LQKAAKATKPDRQNLHDASIAAEILNAPAQSNDILFFSADKLHHRRGLRLVVVRRGRAAASWKPLWSRMIFDVRIRRRPALERRAPPFTAPKDEHGLDGHRSSRCIARLYDMVLQWLGTGRWIGAYSPCGSATKKYLTPTSRLVENTQQKFGFLLSTRCNDAPPTTVCHLGWTASSR